MKELVYTKDLTVEYLFIGGYSHKNLTISGRIYKETKKSWFKKPKIKYTYTISTPLIEDPFYDGEYGTNPLIEDPFYDGEYGTNRILKAYSIQMKQHLIDKIQEFKENEGNDSSRASKEKEGFREKTKYVYP